MQNNKAVMQNKADMQSIKKDARNKKTGASSLKWMLKHYIFLAVAVFIIAFVLFSVTGLREISDMREIRKHLPEYGEEYSQAIQYYTKEITINYIYRPLNLELICAVLGGIGFGSAMVLFSHLFSKKQAMMMASLPVKREKDLLERILTFAILAIIPVAACMAMYPIAVVVNGMWDWFDFGLYVRRCVDGLLIVLYGFSVGTLCSFLCGTYWSVVLLGLVMVFSAEGVIYLWRFIAYGYLNTMPTIKFNELKNWSPVVSLYKGFGEPGSMNVLPAVLAIILFLGLAFAAVRRFMPENAGLTLNQKGIEKPGLVWLSIVGGTLGSLIMVLAFYEEYGIYLGFLAGALIIWLVTRMLLDQNIRASLKTWPIPLACAAVLCLCGLGLKNDIFGYNSYLPEPGKASSVAWSSGWYSDSPGGKLKEPENVEEIRQWVSILRDEAEDRRKERNWSRYHENSVFVEWETDGKKISRCYEFPKNQEKALKHLDKIIASEEYVNNLLKNELPYMYGSIVVPTFNRWDEEFSEYIGISYTGSQRKLNRFKIDEIRNAMRKDLASRTVRDMQLPRVFDINFYGYDEDSGYEPGSENYSLTTHDVNTLKLIFGDNMQKWLDYANGSFLDDEDIVAFRCKYAEKGKGEGEAGEEAGEGESEEEGEGDEVELVYQKAESPEQAREWMKQTTSCENPLYQAPLDPSGEVLRVYSKSMVLEEAEYQDIELTEEDMDRLPEYDGMPCGVVYYFMAESYLGN